MGDLISRQAAIDCEYQVKIINDIEYVMLSEVQMKMRKLSSADRPQGEWRDMGDFEKCSVCKATHLKEFQSYYGKVIWIKTPYCPQCGARMKGVGDE